MPDLSNVEELTSELESAVINFADYHANMYLYPAYYKHSAFYKPKAGRVPSDLRANLLKVFADKNIQFTSRVPDINVLTTGSTPEERNQASIREKILLGVHQKSGTDILQRKWAFDGTLRSVAIAETGFDIKKRCAWVKRYDPRYVFWQRSNGNDGSVLAFWAVFPITADECEEKYGFRPKGNTGFSGDIFQDKYLSTIDGKDWFMEAIRWDSTTRVAWVGDRLIEEPHNHLMGHIPVDMAVPFQEEDVDGNSLETGIFYLEQLVPLQAELNDTIRKRSAIVQRMANPVVWGRGIHARQFDEVKANMEKSGGGFVGLKQQGELGLLQVQDVTLLKEQEDQIVNYMMKISGFSGASFGESVGANTSGDALGMYFTPTIRLIENQNVAWKAFYKSINAKILKLYDRFLQIGEEVSISGFAPASTVTTPTDDRSASYQGGYFNIKFTKEDIAGNYDSEVTFPVVTPKNEDLDRRFWLDAANQGIVSRTTAYEKMGIKSPQDELALITNEQGDPVLNPDGTAKIMQSASAFAQSQQPTAPVSGVENGA